MKEAAGRISRRVRQIAWQPARMSFRSTEASSVVVRDKISRPGSNGIFASLAHNRLPWAHALLSAIAAAEVRPPKQRTM
jgi:hypothetical protein